MANEKSYRLKDASLKATVALPAALSTTVYSDSFDLGTANQKLLRGEFEISAEALDTTALPNGETVTYGLQDSADDSTFAAVQDTVLVQTGASGAGAAAATERIGIPSTLRRYVRVSAVTSSGTGDCSGSDLTFEFVG